jgi:hypothetical protein
MGAVLPILLALLSATPAAALDGAAPAAGTADAGTIVEEVVAVVRNPPGSPPRAITRTRLVEEARIVLVSRGAAEAAFRPIDDRALAATLAWLVDQTLLADEAARLQLAEVGRDQAAAELRRFQARFPDRAAWGRFLAATALTEEEVSGVLSRMLRVDRYLETRLGKGGTVEDADVVAFARERGLPLEGRAAREAVRARLAELRLEAAVQELLAELRGRAEVRVLSPALAPAGKGS